MYRVIIINGSNSSGKDNFAESFIKHYKYPAVNVSTIDRVKELAIKYFGWDGKKTEPARKFLAEMKQIWAEFNNGPFLYTVSEIKKIESSLKKKDKKNLIVFVHCREPEEIQKFKDKYQEKCLAVLLKREERTENKKIANNHADMGVDNYNYDRIILNNGSKIDLEKQAIEFLESITKEVPVKESTKMSEFDKIVTEFIDILTKDPSIKKSTEISPEIGKIYFLDLGSLAPVEVKVLDIKGNKVICEYLKSTPGRIETLSIDFFPKTFNK